MAVAGSPFVYFTRLELTNVRSFGERQVLVLEDSNGKPAPWTLILGDNGVGKTTLLQCLVMMRPRLGTEGAEPNAPKPTRIEPELFGRENNEIEGLARMGARDVRLGAELSVGHALGQPGGRMTRLNTEASFTMKGRGLDSIKSTPAHRRGFVEPLVIGYGAARHVTSGASDALEEDSEPTASLFDASLELSDAQRILEDLDYASLKEQPHAGDLLKAVKAALVTLLPDLKSADDIHLYGPSTPRSRGGKSGVQVVTPYGEVPLSALSLGYQTMTAWTVDLAWRLYRHYPDVDEPLRQPAIVLIDELDLHLHPHWQRQLRNHLSAAFPQVQFIATAHSPLLAQTYLDTNLAVVRREENQAVIVNDPEVIKTWRLDELVTSALYDIRSPYSPDVTYALQRRTELLQKSRTTPNERRELVDLEALAASLSPTPSPEDRDAMEMIRQAAKLLDAHKP
ncbi:MAG: AAA family ATPase [Caulobacteraceae bacterium]